MSWSMSSRTPIPCKPRSSGDCAASPVDGDDDWTRFQIRPGALFLVGDPKQAIYRFRGADVGAYVQARDAFRAQDPDSVLSISTNFRSCASILTYVNERFEAVLSADGQPGFTALDPFHDDRGDGLCVAALDVAVADENGKASAEQQRDAEAEAVAELCARLIGSEMILDRRSGRRRALPTRRHRLAGADRQRSCGATKRRWSAAAFRWRPRPAKVCFAARKSRI